MSRLSRPIDRAMFLRAIAEINRREPASAVKIAERLQIPNRLTPMAESMIGAAV